MKGNKKIILICALAVEVVAAIVLIITDIGKDNGTEDKQQLIAVTEEPGTGETEETGLEVVLEPVEDAGEDKIDSKNFVYDPFAEDAGWGNESIFGSLIIEGTGVRDDSLDIKEPTIELDDNIASKNIRELTPAEAQAAVMEKVKSKDYAYRINENDYSEGFGIYINPKYELGVSRIMGDTGVMHAPNDTEVYITELDPSEDLDYYRRELLYELGYRDVYNYSGGANMPYDTEVEIGTGIVNFESSEFPAMWHGEDASVNSYGGQLFCDTEVTSKFGSGYYIECYEPMAGFYSGYYLVEHNGRIFKVKGESMYRDTLIDITLATIDTCVYPY